MSEKPASLPVDLRETRSLQVVKFDSTTIPWLQEPEHTTIGLWTFKDHKEILVASCVSPKLSKVAEMIKESRPAADNAFYQLVYLVAHNQFTNLPRLDSPKAEYPTYYTKAGNLRVYGLLIGQRAVARLFPILGSEHALIVRIAQCRKANQGQVYKFISTDSKSHS